MQTLTYKSIEIPIKSTATHKLLISNKDLADICFVYEQLLDSTRVLNPSILYENTHYIKDDDMIYWTPKGIIRVCILLVNPEALKFADFIEIWN
jgi:hypothetical protein